MKKIFLCCCIALSSFYVSALAKVHEQNDTLSRIIDATFQDKKIKRLVYFDYTGVNDFPTFLSNGKHAFIYPDSVFTSHYPSIHTLLANTWGAEQKLFTLTYLKNQSDSSIVFIKSHITTDKNIIHYVVFNDIQISQTEARLKFRTEYTQFEGEKPRPIYVFNVLLKFSDGAWSVRDVDIKKRRADKPIYRK